MKNKLWKISTIIFIILTLCLLVMFIKISSENNIYMNILKVDGDFTIISRDGQLAEQYYAEAVYAYEAGNYDLVESNCRLARKHYSLESQGYKKIKAELKAQEINDLLIINYIEQFDMLSEMTENMYEACEHLESAVRYYNIDDSEVGDVAIDNMNEKIAAHDVAVRKYNNKMEEFRIELQKRLKD